MTRSGICYVFRRARVIAGKRVVAASYYGKLRMPWETGSPRVFSLDTTDKRTAGEIQHEKARELQMERRGLLPARSVRDAEGKPLLGLLADYLADLRAKGRAEGTLAKYDSNVRTVLVECGWVSLRNVNARDFTQWRVRRKRHPRSQNDMLANVGAFMRWLVRQRMALENPLAGVGRVDTRHVKRYRRALSEEEQRRLVERSPQGRAVIYLLMLETGIRRKEMNALKWEHFVLETPRPFVRLPGTITKNGKEACQHLRPHVVAALYAMKNPEVAESDFVFRWRVPRISTFKRDLARAGIEFENEHGRADLHALRVTLNTNLCRVGVPIVHAKVLMRHSDVKLTMRNYLDESQLPLAAALNALPVIVAPATRPAPQCGAKQGRGSVAHVA